MKGSSADNGMTFLPAPVKKNGRHRQVFVFIEKKYIVGKKEMLRAIPLQFIGFVAGIISYGIALRMG